ncbi:MAG: hypothetical protein RR409_13850 [Clostridium sp.]
MSNKIHYKSSRRFSAALAFSAILNIVEKLELYYKAEYFTFFY